MVDYKRILQLSGDGVSQRGIAEVLGFSRHTVAAAFVAAVFVAAAGQGVVFADVEGLDTKAVRARLFGEPMARRIQDAATGFARISAFILRSLKRRPWILMDRAGTHSQS